MFNAKKRLTVIRQKKVFNPKQRLTLIRKASALP